MVADTTSLRTRLISRRLLNALDSSPVVLIHGPRQCGKTTLVRMTCVHDEIGKRQLAQSLNECPKSTNSYVYLSFDNPATLDFAVTDPIGFVDDLPDYVILDEIQRVPQLLEVIKLSVDKHDQPGRFLLTGSANILQMPKVSETLAGHMQSIPLRSFAQVELKQSANQANPSSDFLTRAFHDGFNVDSANRLGDKLIQKIIRGGYPRAIATQDAATSVNWYRSYAEALAHQDLMNLSRLRSPVTFQRLFNVATSQTARVFNLSSLASEFEFSRPTIDSYVQWMERLFIIEKLPPWFSHRLKRVIKSSKLHVADTGLAAAASNVDMVALKQDRKLLRQFVESFVYSELRKQASWFSEHLDFYHFRDKERAEVDIVLENSSEQLVGIEVKAAATVHKNDFRGLKKLANAVGERFLRGIVLYDGKQTLPAGNRFLAVPIRRLWAA